MTAASRKIRSRAEGRGRAIAQSVTGQLCAITGDDVYLQPAAGTAYIYPILLEDQLIVLLHTSDGIQLANVGMGRTDVEATAGEFTAVSPDSESDGYKVLGLTLHEWLIGSFEDALVEAAVTQLVFVTTELVFVTTELVGVPFAALPGRDGFLVERFAVSIVPFVERARPPRAG